MDLYGKKVLVVGLARTGIGTVRFLKARGSIVTTTETKSREEMKEASRPWKGLSFQRSGVAISRDFPQARPRCGESGG